MKTAHAADITGQDGSYLAALLLGERYEADGIIVGIARWEGMLACDASMPDGIPRELVDGERMRGLKWEARIDLRTGIAVTYEQVVAATEEHS